MQSKDHSITSDGVEYKAAATGDYKAVSDGASDENVHFVEHILTQQKQLSFNGTARVKSAADVAHIFKNLETASVENAFVVHVGKRGKSHIQFLSTGGRERTLFDVRQVLVGVKHFGSQRLYLVHNHPSGNLNPSPADLDITDIVKTIGIPTNHIIIDTYKQEYAVIGEYGGVEKHKRSVANSDSKRLKYYAFDTMRGLREPIGNIRCSYDAVSVIQQLRFSALPKSGMLVLNSTNAVVGNFLFAGSEPTFDETLANFAKAATATSVVFYGNTRSSAEKIGELQQQLDELKITLTDNIVLQSNGDSVVGAYKSYKDEGLLFETQAKYGTAFKVKEPATMAETFKNVLSKKEQKIVENRIKTYKKEAEKRGGMHSFDIEQEIWGDEWGKSKYNTGYYRDQDLVLLYLSKGNPSGTLSDMARWYKENYDYAAYPLEGNLRYMKDVGIINADLNMGLDNISLPQTYEHNRNKIRPDSWEYDPKYTENDYAINKKSSNRYEVSRRETDSDGNQHFKFIGIMSKSDAENFVKAKTTIELYDKSGSSVTTGLSLPATTTATAFLDRPLQHFFEQARAAKATLHADLATGRSANGEPTPEQIQHLTALANSDRKGTTNSTTNQILGGNLTKNNNTVSVSAIGGVPLTPEQRKALAAGQAITVAGATQKSGAIGDISVRLNPQSSCLEYGRKADGSIQKQESCLKKKKTRHI
jgi:hypothetical protein